MAERHEEKYLIDYRQYALLKNNAMRVLTPDRNSDNGSYWITSLYYDDYANTALLEKQDGLPRHTKFRLRTYNSSRDFIRLERKVKEGIMTQKQTAVVTPEQLSYLGLPQWDLQHFSEEAFRLAAQMQAYGLKPAATVRYHRDAFFFPGTDLRLTFDTCLELLSPTQESLFDPECPGVPVLDLDTVIMEIKYGSYVPTFIRKLTAVPSRQLSVSKYALCREKVM